MKSGATRQDWRHAAKPWSEESTEKLGPDILPAIAREPRTCARASDPRSDVAAYQPHVAAARVPRPQVWVEVDFLGLSAPEGMHTAGRESPGRKQQGHEVSPPENIGLAGTRRQSMWISY